MSFRLVPPDWWLDVPADSPSSRHLGRPNPNDASPQLDGHPFAEPGGPGYGPSPPGLPSGWRHPRVDLNNPAAARSGVTGDYPWGVWSAPLNLAEERVHSPIVHDPDPDPDTIRFSGWTVQARTHVTATANGPGGTSAAITGQSAVATATCPDVSDETLQPVS